MVEFERRKKSELAIESCRTCEVFARLLTDSELFD